jgi:REP element-mobilizing transposase RayT
MGRGIERTQIFRDDTDRADCVARLAARCRQAHRVVYAWARMPNHFHLLVRPGQSRFVRSMKKLPTGDVATVNRRHKGSGQLVQNWLARKVTAPALLS